MARVRNTHTATIDGIAPGAVGEVDETAGVLLFVKAGHLELQGGVTVEELAAVVQRRAQGERSAAPAGPGVSDYNRAVDEIERRGTVITGLRDELDAARNRVGQLEAEVADAVRRADNEAASSILNREHGQRLEAEVAQLKLDLEAATAPAKDAKDPSTKKKSAATAEG